MTLGPFQFLVNGAAVAPDAEVVVRGDPTLALDGLDGAYARIADVRPEGTAFDAASERQLAYSAERRVSYGTTAKRGTLLVEFNHHNKLVVAVRVRLTDAPPATPAGPVVRVGSVRPKGDLDGRGQTYQQTSAEPWTTLVGPGRDGVAIRNLRLDAPARDTFALFVDRDGVTVENVTFADGCAYPCKVTKDGARLLGLRGETFANYFVYGEGSDDLVIADHVVRGGSTGESIYRFDDCRNVSIARVEARYTTAARKACLRGAFAGTVVDSTFAGAVVGPNPLIGVDGGQAYGVHHFLTNRIVWADNAAECLAVTAIARAAGETDPLEVARVCADVARVGGRPVAVSADHLRQTLARRAAELAKRSDVTFARCTIDFGLRWDAGSQLRFDDCTVRGNDAWGPADGAVFHGVGLAYPEPAYLLPGDVARPYDGPRFSRCRFESAGLTREAFLDQCRRFDVRLAACTFNGQPVPDRGAT